MTATDLARFERYVELIPFHACWQWVGPHRHHGYGCMSVGGRVQYAHRLSYERHVGPIPSGAVLDHLCRNTSCVNHRHLEPVSHRVNVLRGTAPAARHARATHCPHGHPLDGFSKLRPGNRRGGFRHCKTCKRAYQSEWQRAKRAAARGTA